jgi:predicted ArsR family transcriptional regulator
MADAIAESTRTGAPILEAIKDAAAVRGATLADAAAERPREADAALDFAVGILSEHGYEPRRTDHTIAMTNCPFHALAARHPEIVCGLNHSLLGGFVDAAAPGLLDARLEPGENRCCVLLTAGE